MFLLDYAPVSVCFRLNRSVYSLPRFSQPFVDLADIVSNLKFY